MIQIRALAASLRILLGLAALALTASASFAEVAGVRFGGPPLTLVMTVDIGERAFPPQGRAALAVADGRDELVFQGPVPYRVSRAQLRVEHPFPPAKVPQIRDRVRVTLVVNDRKGTQRTFRAAATNPRLPGTLVNSGASKPLLLVRGDGQPEFIEVQKRTLTVRVTGGGRVTSSPPGIDCSDTDKTKCTHEFASDVRSVLLRATPSTGTSVTWTGCPRPVDNDCPVVMDKPEWEATAAFSASPVLVTLQNRLVVRVTGPGAVTSAPTGIKCREKAQKGCEETFKQDTVNLTIAPDVGAVAVVGCPAGQTKCTVSHKLDRRTELTVVFKTAVPEPVRLTVNVTGGGTVRLKDSDRPPCVSSGCSFEVPRGEPVTLLAEPGARQRLKDWGGVCQPHKRELRCTVTLTRAETVVAAFDSNPFSISVKASPGLVVSVSPPGSLPDGKCREACEVFFPDQTPVTLEARKVQSDGESSVEAAQVAWKGCDSYPGARCSITQLRAQTVSLGLKAGWAPTLQLLGFLSLFLAVGYWALRRFIPWRPRLKGPKLPTREGADPQHQRQLDERAREIMANPAAQLKREPPWPGSEASPANGAPSVPQPVLDGSTHQIQDDRGTGPQSGSGIETATQGLIPADMTDDEAKVVVAVNAEWQEILAGKALNRPALRERLQRAGIQSDFYNQKNFLARLETLVQSAYTFTQATTTGSWLLVQTSPAGRWLALPLTHAEISEMGMTVVKRLFDGWDKLPAKYRFERAYRPCVLRQLSGTELAFELERKGYFTLEGAQASSPPPPAPPAYGALVTGPGSPPVPFSHAEAPMDTEGLMRFQRQLHERVDGIESRLLARMDAEARQLASHGKRVETMERALEALVDRPTPEASGEPADATIEQLLSTFEERLNFKLLQLQTRMNEEVQQRVAEELDRRDKGRAESRGEPDAQAAPPPAPTKTTDNPADSSPQTSPDHFVKKWLPQLPPFAGAVDQEASDEDIYLAGLRHCHDKLHAVPEQERSSMPIEIVHLEVVDGELRFIEVKAEDGAPLRCGECPRLPGAKPYQHFVAVRSLNQATVVLPPGCVATREKWPRGFQLLLGEAVKTSRLHGAGIEQTALLTRHTSDGFKVTRLMRVH